MKAELVNRAYSRTIFGRVLVLAIEVDLWKWGLAVIGEANSSNDIRLDCHIGPIWLTLKSWAATTWFLNDDD